MRETPSCSGFSFRPPPPCYVTGMRCCWEWQYQGGSIRRMVSWLREHRPDREARVTAVIRSGKSTWVVDIHQDDLRITHFKNFNSWMSDRMKLWWRQRKAKLGEATV